MVSTLLIFSGRPSLKCFSPSLNPKIDKRIPSFERQKRQISFKFKMPMLFLSNNSVLFICTRLIELDSLLRNNTKNNTAAKLKHHLNKLQPISLLYQWEYFIFTLLGCCTVNEKGTIVERPKPTIVLFSVYSYTK